MFKGVGGYTEGVHVPFIPGVFSLFQCLREGLDLFALVAGGGGGPQDLVWSVGPRIVSAGDGFHIFDIADGGAALGTIGCRSGRWGMRVGADHKWGDISAVCFEREPGTTFSA